MSPKLLQMLRSAEFSRLAFAAPFQERRSGVSAYQRGGECGDAVKYLKECKWDRWRAQRSPVSDMIEGRMR
jgi:hypothetical protein